MARSRAVESARSRPKGVLIEELSRGIDRFQELLTAIDDFSQEGFPYRDAAQAKAELQFRESVRRIFGERSDEFQTYRNYKLRTSNKDEVAQSVALIKTLMKTLEDRKLELQGLKPPSVVPSSPETNPLPPQMTLVPPTAHISTGPQRINPASPMTVSVSLATNLGARPSPAAAPTAPPPVTPTAQPLPAVSAPSGPSSRTLMSQSAPLHPEDAAMTPTAGIADPSAPPAPHHHDKDHTPAQPKSSSAMALSPTPSPPDTHSTQPATPPDPAPRIADQPEALSPSALPPIQPSPTAARTTPEVRTGLSDREQEPLQLLRKVCLRFHAVARQLRLRKEYRTTLEVEDDYDLQDLLCALLKLEFDEVGTDEWTPPYTGGAPRTTLLLNKDQIAVVAKKTRPGLTAKELADQVAADSAYYRAQDKCATLFFFIYDPEGRIGSPKRLETNLTSVSERCTVEVLVAPK
jgi:hypothetical protein